MNATQVSSSRWSLARPSLRQMALASAALGGVGAAVLPVQPAGAHEYYESVYDAAGGTRAGVSTNHDIVRICHQGSGLGHIVYRMAGGGMGILEAYGQCTSRDTGGRVTQFQVCDLRIGRCTAWKTA